MKIFNRQIYLCSPIKCDNVIYHTEGGHYITEYILHGIPTFTYNMSPPNYYVSFSIFYNFIKTLSDFNWNVIKERKKIRAFVKELLRHYHLGCLQFINPKVIITFIDNSSDYHWLCKKYKDAHFLAIQNGNRTNVQLEKTIMQYHKHFYCFGNYERDRYARFVHHADFFHPIGSLLGGYYKYNYGKDFVKKYDISIVSQYKIQPLSLVQEDDNLMRMSIDKINSFLSKYITEYGLRAAVFSRKNSKYEVSHEYHKKYYADSVEYINNENKSISSTYRGMEESEIIISFNSTATIEAFGWGKKILHCDFTGTKKHNDYDSMIMFTEPNYESFKKRLNELRSEPYDEYRERTREYASYLMNNDPDCPPHKYIRQKIEEFL
jgi:surface carbohydrate biosynthesis protein